ncbi:hypothetical protein FNU76_05155 [Chitinimonas arctica]|uniref:Uncharacterized protein n=1 Tax=Chitinimonas arctica TaxID=2594795 RepID=A0A516SCB3_9NEIS|nr:hypothetical protein [Chitinimonas arctica]QDQ25787.1 hypothetical protein FNU76_05155 [Chitinimonas arctica]
MQIHARDGKLARTYIRYQQSNGQAVRKRRKCIRIHRLAILLFVGLILTNMAFFTIWQIDRQHARLEVAQLQRDHADALRTLTEQSNNQLAIARDRNDQLQASAYAEMVALHTRSNVRLQTIENLERENAALRLTGGVRLTLEHARPRRAQDSALPGNRLLTQNEPALPIAAQTGTERTGGEPLP